MMMLNLVQVSQRRFDIRAGQVVLVEIIQEDRILFPSRSMWIARTTFISSGGQHWGDKFKTFDEALKQGESWANQLKDIINQD
jgi:hypothetical protein